MRDLLDDLLRWWTAGETAGLALVTRTWASAPRPVGAAMLVGPGGEAVGSVSGGCVEAEVYELCRSPGPARLVRFGVGDEHAFRAGLPCGGTVELIVLPVRRDTMPDLPALVAHVRDGRPAALLTRLDPAARQLVVTPAARLGSLGGGDRLDDEATAQARVLIAAGTSGTLGDDPGVLVNVFPVAARMLVFGATDHAAAVARIGAFLGYRVTVCDPRPVFATARRFPDAREVVVDWPQRYLAAEAAAGRIDPRTVVCVLTHDPRFDVPVLVEALPLRLAYVGAMGSRRTHEDRLDRLRAAGVTAAELDGLASPIGLDLGARTPEETAVSVAAEIVALRRGGTGAPLRTTAGPVHRTAP